MDCDVQFNLLAPAFVNGTGDYVTLFEPTASQLVLENNLHIVAAIGMDGGEVPYTSFIALKSYMAKSEAKLEVFLNCIYKATQWVANNTDAAAAAVLAPQFPSPRLIFWRLRLKTTATTMRGTLNPCCRACF